MPEKVEENSIKDKWYVIHVNITLIVQVCLISFIVQVLCIYLVTSLTSFNFKFTIIDYWPDSVNYFCDTKLNVFTLE